MFRIELLLNSIAAATLATLVQTLIATMLAIAGQGTLSTLSSIVIYSALAYYIQWSLLHRGRGISEFLVAGTDIGRMTSFALKDFLLHGFGVVATLILMPLFGVLLDAGSPYFMQLVYPGVLSAVTGMTYGYCGLLLPTTIAGKHMTFQQAVLRGKRNLVRTARTSALALFLGNLGYQLLLQVFDLNASRATDDIKLQAISHLLGGLVNGATTIAIGIALVSAYLETQPTETKPAFVTE